MSPTSVELRLLVQRFLAVLPAKWEGVFRARFLERLDQRSGGAAGWACAGPRWPIRR